MECQFAVTGIAAKTSAKSRPHMPHQPEDTWNMSEGTSLATIRTIVLLVSACADKKVNLDTCTKDITKAVTGPLCSLYRDRATTANLSCHANVHV